MRRDVQRLPRNSKKGKRNPRGAKAVCLKAEVAEVVTTCCFSSS